MKRRVLFISPHLDDAVLSCAATIAQAVNRGHDVLVVTCFSSPGCLINDSLQCHYQRRKQDDINALSVLGARSLHLDFVDAPFRHATYNGFSTILFHHTLPEIERPLAEEIVKKLNDVITPFDILYFPLGVGGHIDHHIVFESSRLISQKNSDIKLYEEIPYALIPGWNAVRWQQIGGKPSKLCDAYFKKASLFDLSLPFVDNYMASLHDKSESATLYEKEFALLHPSMPASHYWTFNNMLFKNKIIDNVCAQRIRAILCYTTEWPVLFGANENSITTLIKTIKERFWELA
jgi:LmbE family N-acetylglucosaminyl deacetylase